MPYEVSIALRHLRGRKSRSLSVVTWLAVTGVALGVTALVGGFSVTSGFEEAFSEKVMGVTAHVFVREYGIDFSEYREVQAALERVPGVRGTSPMTFNEVMFSGKGGTAGAIVKGLQPAQASSVLKVREYMTEGSLDALVPKTKKGIPAVILGAELARSVGANAGDLITAVSPMRTLDPDRWSATPDVPATQTLEVVGVFRAGFQEYDARLAYMALPAAQRFFATGDTVVGIEVAVDDPLRAGVVARRMRAALGEEAYSVLDWRRQNRNLFASLTYQRVAILVVLSVMVVLASCNVACMLILLVIERTRDIAILKAMGAKAGGILRLFIMEGMFIGVVGTIIGMVLAYGLCEGLLANGISLDPKVYGIARLPVVLRPMDYAMAAAGALTITFFATIFPALRGARLRPVDGLRDGRG